MLSGSKIEESAPGFWQHRRDMECVVALLGSGRLDVGPRVTDRLPPAGVPDLYGRLMRWDPGVLAAVIEWGDG